MWSLILQPIRCLADFSHHCSFVYFQAATTSWTSVRRTRIVSTLLLSFILTLPWHFLGCGFLDNDTCIGISFTSSFCCYLCDLCCYFPDFVWVAHPSGTCFLLLPTRSRCRSWEHFLPANRPINAWSYGLPYMAKIKFRGFSQSMYLVDIVVSKRKLSPLTLWKNFMHLVPLLI